MVTGTRYLVLRTVHLVGTWYLVPGTWYQLPLFGTFGTEYCSKQLRLSSRLWGQIKWYPQGNTYLDNYLDKMVTLSQKHVI